jgi:hypothetical protein
MPQQQQPLDEGLAECEELFPAARDDPQKHDSPPLSPIAIRQVMKNRIRRPQKTTAEISRIFLGMRGREPPI